MLLSSMPRAEPSRLAWLSQTLIAMASGRINQNYYLFFLEIHTCFVVNVLTKPGVKRKGISGHFNECPHRHNTNVRTNYRVIHHHRFAFRSPLKQPYYIRIQRIYTLRTIRDFTGVSSRNTPRFGLHCEVTLFVLRSYKTTGTIATHSTAVRTPLHVAETM